MSGRQGHITVPVSLFPVDFPRHARARAMTPAASPLSLEIKRWLSRQGAWQPDTRQLGRDSSSGCFRPKAGNSAPFPGQPPAGLTRNTSLPPGDGNRAYPLTSRSLHSLENKVFMTITRSQHMIVCLPKPEESSEITAGSLLSAESKAHQ